jgi:fructokinase
MEKRPIQLLSVGELLIDLMSADFADTFDEVENFKRVPGGSPANLCMNMARLGNTTKLVASVGKDDFGSYLINYLNVSGFDSELVKRSDKPTTLILVTRSKQVSNFEPYRGADAQIEDAQMTNEILTNTNIFHTTCFALSKEPAQSAILRGAARATAQGCRLSIDANYAQKIWNDRNEAQNIVRQYISHKAFVKMSEVDFERLFDKKLTDPNEALDFLLGWGASEVCITLGGDGCWVASDTERHFLPSRPIEVKDTTGAGDAFWSGFLTARLDGRSLLEAAKAARRMAEIKIAHFGALPSQLDKNLIYSDL